MPFLKINGSDIYYSDQGTGQPVVMLHGRSASSALWDWHIQHLKKDYRVIAYDSVNHGFSNNSPVGEVEPDRVVELDQLLEALEIERPVLIGQSMGSMTSLRWATQNPSRAHAVIAAGMGWPLPPLGSVSPAPLRDGLWLESRNFNAAWEAEHQDFIAQYSRMRSTATAIEYSLRPRQMFQGDFFDEGFRDKLAAIQSPVSLFCGQDDFFIEPARSLATIIPGARLVEMPNAHHNAYVQCLDEFLALVRETLSAVGIEPAGSTR